MIWIAAGAVALLALAVFQFGSAGTLWARSTWKTRRSRQACMWELRQAAEIARLSCELESSDASNLGWRVMEVAEVADESEDCRSFYLVDPYGQPLPDFRPGQYLMVRPALAGAYQTTRCYSLSSAPDEEYWRITVKRQESPDQNLTQKQKGGLSRWLHDRIGPGDCLLIGGPSGQFYLPENSTRPLVLMAAGVGITPMASMLRWSLEATPERSVVLLYQAKDLDHWPLGECLHEWQRDFPNIQIQSYFSRASESEISELAKALAGETHRGKFGVEQALQANATAIAPTGEHCDFFMCGPDPWMQSLRGGLLEAGIAEEQLHWESFGATGTQPKLPNAEAADAVEVRFEHSQVDAQWSDSEQTLWELARESDVEIPSGCLSGVCGCCRVKLLQGEVQYDREVSIELAKDECLTCVSRPTSPVVLDV